MSQVVQQGLNVITRVLMTDRRRRQKWWDREGSDGATAKEQPEAPDKCTLRPAEYVQPGLHLGLDC